MAKLDRKDVKIFAENSKETLVTEFRTEDSQGSTASFSRDPDVIQNENYSQGWVNDSNNLNTKIYGEDLNAVSYVLSYLLKYLYENGIAEWKNTTTYCQNSISKIDDTLYISLQDNNLGNDPINTVGYWRAVVLDTITSVLAGNGADIVKAISGNHITFKSLSVDGYGSLQDNGDNINIHVLGGSGIIDAYWGQIQGTLTNQADLIEALGDKQDNLTFDTPLSKDVNNEVSISTADTSTTGALTSTDWNTFSGKANTQKVVADTESTMTTLYLESNTLYTFSRPLTYLTIASIPSDTYEVEIQFTTGTNFIFHASVLNNKWLGGNGNTPTFRAGGYSYVIVIKNGYGFCANTFTNNPVFQNYISLKSTNANDVYLENLDSKLNLSFYEEGGGYPFRYSFGFDSFMPYNDSSVDLGSSDNQWNNLYLSGTANVGALTSSGAISGTTGNFSGQVSTSNVAIGGDSNVGIVAYDANTLHFGGTTKRTSSLISSFVSSMNVYNESAGSPSNFITTLLLSSGASTHEFRPNITEKISLGNPGCLWNGVYSNTGNFSNDLYVAGSPIVGSGIALKNNIIDADSVYNKVKLLSAKTYTLKIDEVDSVKEEIIKLEEELLEEKTSVTEVPMHYGVIAEEVISIFPDIVRETIEIKIDEDTKEEKEITKLGIDLYGYSTIILKGLQETMEKAEKSETLIGEIETSIDKIESLVDALEARVAELENK